MVTLFLSRRIVQYLFCGVTFAVIFIYHSSPLFLSDLWWHLNTGRWIWMHGEIPVADPFLFSSPLPLDARASLILRGYPLSQLLIFGAYNTGGAYALVVLKGALMTLLYGLMWNLFRRNGLHPVSALAVVGALPLLFFVFDELRPQMFSFIGALLVVQLVEYILERERQGNPLKAYALMSLPVIMLLWANLHRGYIIGVGVLFVYLFAEWFIRKRGGNALPDDGFRRFLIVVLVSAGISFLNPAGLTAVWASFTEVSGPFAKVIDEFFWPPKYFEFHGMKHLGYIVVAVGLIPSLALLLKWRQLGIAHMLILTSFLAAGLLSFRFSLMMVAIVLAIAIFYFARDLNRLLFSGKGIPVILLWCVVTGFLSHQALSRTSLAASQLENGVIPSAATDYLMRSNIAGNIYNPFEYGGYLSWRLYPRKFFIDPRNLSWDVYMEYSEIESGSYAEIFRKYQIDTVLHSVYSNGKASRLIAALFNDSEWRVGYYDGVDIIFIKRNTNENLPSLNKREVMDEIVRRFNS